MHTIQISTDLYAKIWSLWQDGDVNEEDILRRQLNCPITSATHKATAIKQINKGYRDPRFGVFFPEGFEIFRKNGAAKAVAIHRGWEMDGNKYYSMNHLSDVGLLRNENAWNNWYYSGQNGKEEPVTNLRDPSKIRRRRIVLNSLDR